MAYPLYKPQIVQFLVVLQAAMQRSLLLPNSLRAFAGSKIGTKLAKKDDLCEATLEGVIKKV